MGTPDVAMDLGSAQVIRANARDLPLADDSVDLVVTSPPYFALRSYQDGGEHYEGQIGDEPTPAEFVASLLEVTRECVRVLKPSGSLWVNLGDKYAGNAAPSRHGQGATGLQDFGAKTLRIGVGDTALQRDFGIRAKSLIGIPWRYALACIDDLGLILRAEVIWSKPNGLPESVTDRVRRSHEQWFHFVLQPRYFSAVDEIREAHKPESIAHAQRYGQSARAHTPNADRGDLGAGRFGADPLGKLPGSVWTVPTEPLRVPDHLGIDHFAAFPTEWPRRIIQGWSPSGVCVACGEGRRPIVLKEKVGGWQRGVTSTRARGYGQHVVGGDAPGAWVHDSVSATVTGYACACPQAEWEPVTECGCDPATGIHAVTCDFWPRYVQPVKLPDTRPAVILDPFGGTGTTAMVAKALGRHGITVDMSADYCRLAAWRTNDRDQLAKVLGIAKTGPADDHQLDLFGEPA